MGIRTGVKPEQEEWYILAGKAAAMHDRINKLKEELAEAQRELFRIQDEKDHIQWNWDHPPKSQG